MELKKEGKGRGYLCKNYLGFEYGMMIPETGEIVFKDFKYEKEGGQKT